MDRAPSVEVLPQGMVLCVNRARPEGATLSIWSKRLAPPACKRAMLLGYRTEQMRGKPCATLSAGPVFATRRLQRRHISAM